MRIVRRAPWFYWMIVRFVGVPDILAVYTYGDTVYAPNLPRGRDLPRDLIVHEATHSRQQGRLPLVWWARYLFDSRFRFEQELEAYRAQVDSVSSRARELTTRRIATHFSSPMYGSLVSFEHAYALVSRSRN